MNIPKNMESIFLTVALFGLTAAWVVPSNDQADAQVSANVVAQAQTPAPAQTNHKGV